MADSIREALTLAMADSEAPPTTETPAVTPEPVAAAPVVDTTPAPVIGTPGTDTGKIKPTAVAAPATGKPAVPTATAADAAAAVPAAPAAAPSSWKPAEKAFWDKMPAEAKAAVMRREQETQRALSASAGARKFNDEFQKSMHPFMPIFEAYGVKDPMTAIVPLLHTRAALEVGTDEQKAELISNLVYQFGVDVNKLDNYLVRGPAQQAPPAPTFDPRSVPELAPIFQLAEQYKQVQSQKVDAAIEEVSVLPHFDALREEMADLLDMAAQRGRNLTVKDAYDHAARMAGLAPSPSTAQPNVSEAAAIMARSRKAASSVAGAPKGSPGAKPNSIRDSIVAAMEG